MSGLRSGESVTKWVDVPSALMTLVFSANLVISVLYRSDSLALKDVGNVIVVPGVLLLSYALLHLKGGFFRETAPKLGHLVKGGPYRFCRHPVYLAFIMMMVGIDLALGSALGLGLTVVLAAPSALYRANVEDRLLRQRFGEEWEEHARHVGFFFPGLG